MILGGKGLWTKNLVEHVSGDGAWQVANKYEVLRELWKILFSKKPLKIKMF